MHLNLVRIYTTDKAKTEIVKYLKPKCRQISDENKIKKSKSVCNVKNSLIKW
jgi:hypothetical protein